MIDLTGLSPLLCLTLIYLSFRLKHFFADYLLQTSWMACGKSRLHGWSVPLFVHGAVHGTATTVIAVLFAPSLWWLGLVDVAVHTCVDRGKSVVMYQTGWQVNQAPFWWLHGLDQEAHNLTHFIFVLIIVSTLW